jgi:hypothetical protein
MVGPQKISFGEVTLLFHLPRTLSFSILSFNECSLFLLLRLVFIFRLDLCSDLVLSFYQGVFLPLVHAGFIKRVELKKFEWCWKREKIYAKKWYKKELV